MFCVPNFLGVCEKKSFVAKLFQSCLQSCVYIGKPLSVKMLAACNSALAFLGYETNCYCITQGNKIKQYYPHCCRCFHSRYIKCKRNLKRISLNWKSFDWEITFNMQLCLYQPCLSLVIRQQKETIKYVQICYCIIRGRQGKQLHRCFQIKYCKYFKRMC
jgi:hypothetical protein